MNIETELECAEHGTLGDLSDAISRCDELEAELVRLRADAKRLDWLNDQMMQASNDTWHAAGLATSNVTNLRDAIDYTMTVG